MPTKIKILLFTMTAGAGLIMASVFINVGGFANFGANIGQILGGQGNDLNSNSPGSGSTKTGTTKSDIDQDGLFDEEEPIYRTDPLNPDTDGDGFLDGEEINSGHDPLIPGPDDLLLLSNINLTQKLATLTVSGLHEGSLKLDSPKFDESINILVSSVIDDALSDLNTSIDVGKLSFSDSNKSNQEKYIREISEIYKKFLSAYITELNDLEKNLAEIGKSGFANQKVKNYYENKAFEFKEVFNKLLTVNIPENWRTNHLNLLSIVGQLVEINSYIASGDIDPIKALIGLNRLIEILDVVPAITNSYLTEIKKEGLNVESTIFEK